MSVLSVGLTGGIASGKTTVGKLLAERGALIIDSDLLAREVVESGTPGLAAIVERFGASVLASDGTLNRQALGALVFADERARADLNGIVHPAVRQRRAELIAAAVDGSIVVSVIPLLVETGMQDDFDKVIVVDLPVETQLERLQLRNGLDETDARSRIAAQATRQQRLSAADWVIENSGSYDHLRQQVDMVWDQLVAELDEPR
ncbi:dephospho-CoA kinase [Propionimicrobium sp. PCR01-08-3]|uniref:dephospho-CoA kinase n=1 Tax=Propionimicrobium sp. PCR01-08-3 TaxID=3052086 RepID=UPI00255C49DF|nr:dephospho-CoA kinase [Propionimicrobium sp. PCR01-08-3]WIY81629.1 dephospho-CoA kinase [Propionimicrobium sp. PCR01-08-3]